MRRLLAKRWLGWLAVVALLFCVGVVVLLPPSPYDRVK
jgi:hypothetical protein